jgi:hypothetical protein
VAEDNGADGQLSSSGAQLFSTTLSASRAAINDGCGQLNAPPSIERNE